MSSDKQRLADYLKLNSPTLTHSPNKNEVAEVAPATLALAVRRYLDGLPRGPGLVVVGDRFVIRDGREVRLLAMP